MDSIGVPTVLAANQASIRPLKGKIYNNAITDLTKTLLQRHGEIARKLPLASLVSAPDDDKSSRFPVHQGTAAYLADTDVSWSTFFSEQIWNVVLVGGILSWIFAAAWSFLKPRRLDPMRKLLDRLSDITSRARTSSDPRDLIDFRRSDPSALRLRRSPMHVAAHLKNSLRFSSHLNPHVVRSNRCVRRARHRA